MKDIYELLNELNIDYSDVKEVNVSEIERERGKRKLINSLNTRRSNKKKICVAAASLLAVISILSVTLENPTWADNIPIIGEMVQKNLISINHQYEDYINTVGQTKSHGGIDITFENVVADNNRFTFSFVVRNNNSPIENSELLSDITIFLKINGKDINMSGSSQWEVVDQNTVRYLTSVNLDGKDLPKYLNVNIDIPRAFDIDDDWGVKFSMSTKDIKKNTYTEKLDNKFNVSNIDFGLDEIRISPLTTNIKYYAKTNEYLWMKFLVLDQDGNEVKFADGESKDKNCEGGENGKIKFSINYINNGKITSLKLIPRYYDKDYIEKKIGSKKIDLENFSPFEFKLNENMSIDVEDFVIDSGNLILKYNYKYFGKTIFNGTAKGFDLKGDGNSLVENDDDDLITKYKFKDNDIKIYKIGDAKKVEMDFYDGPVNELLEDKSITITKK